MFKKDFLLGAATAAHQVEGNNFNSDCWIMEHIPHSSYDEPSEDAVDHYHRYEEDINYLKCAGLNSYRFSIEWARIEPEEGKWDEAEIEHYKQMIKYCKSNGITPVITYHHFSSPKWLVSDGGWENPKVVDRFAKYAKKLTEEYKDDLEYICTINEANMRLQLKSLIADMKKRMSRGQENSDTSNVQVGFNAMMENMKLQMMEQAQAFGVADPRNIHNFVSECTPEGDLLVMKAHMAAKEAIKAVKPEIKVGLTLSLHNIVAYDGGNQLAQDNWNEEFIHYLPYIAEDDFLGVQCYSNKYFDGNGVAASPEKSPVTQMGYEDVPTAIGDCIRTVAKDFKNDLIVTENGIATDDDDRRQVFIKEATESVEKCIEDGIPVKGYFYWSLLDNFEWQKGYAKTFGLIAVDRTTQTRIPKESLKLLGSLIEKN